jgi:hypothetical protein
MFKLLIFLFLVILIIYCVKSHIKIKWRTFLKKGFKPNRGKFGVYCYCGKQGSGKTYSVVEYLRSVPNNKKIYANISSLNGIEYTYFNGFDELLKLRNESDCVIVYDEIFTALTRTSRINTDVLDFLSQMRKRKIIFLTTAQEWLEINITLRRYCRYQIDCRMRNIYISGILVKVFRDAERMKWDNLENDYIAPILETTISKCNVEVANAYDTREEIKT